MNIRGIFIYLGIATPRVIKKKTKICKKPKAHLQTKRFKKLAIHTKYKKKTSKRRKIKNT